MNSRGTLDDRYSHALSGLAGAAAAALLSPNLTWRKACATILTGFTFSFFVIPFLCAWVGLKEPQALSAAGFLGGVLGCTVVGKLLKWAEEKDLLGFLAERFLKK